MPFNDYGRYQQQDWKDYSGNYDQQYRDWYGGDQYRYNTSMYPPGMYGPADFARYGSDDWNTTTEWTDTGGYSQNWGTPPGEPPPGGETPPLPPLPPPPPPKPGKLKWEEKYHVAGAPDWWIGLVPSKNDPQSEYANMLNSMIPFMSSDDQVYAASQLARLYPNDFGKLYKNISMKGSREVSSEDRQWMGSQERARGILDTLRLVKEATGEHKKYGPGYSFLQDLAGAIRANSGGSGNNYQTRQGYMGMMGAVDPLAAETEQGLLSAYSELTRMLAQPYYTGGLLNPTTQLQNGQVIAGQTMGGYF